MKHKRFQGSLALALFASLTIPSVSATAALAEDNPLPVQPAAREASAERIPVIVMLKDQPTRPDAGAEKSRLATQDELIKKWEEKYDLKPGRQFAYLVNGFAADVPANFIKDLAFEPEVKSVKRERLFYPTEYGARQMEGVPGAYEKYKVDGTGMVISIIDSGVDATHQDMRLDDGVCAKSKIKVDEAHKAEGHFTCKVPAGYNYADSNYVVKDLTTSMHGMHVSGIAAANASPGDVPGDVTTNGGRIDGVAPNAQILAMKVFSNNPDLQGAQDSDIIAAIEDSVKMGADVINMSLGSANGISYASSGSYRAIDAAYKAGTLVVVSAGNEGTNWSPDGTEVDAGGKFDNGPLGTPGSQGKAFTIASVDNNYTSSVVAYWTANGGPEQEVGYSHAIGKLDDVEREVVDGGLGKPENFAGHDAAYYKDKLVLIKRGELSFKDKFANAQKAGAYGVIIYNSQGDSYLGMGGIDDSPLFGVSIYQSSGEKIKAALDKHETVKIRFTTTVSVAHHDGIPVASDFTSWGPTANLDFNPDIAGIGGNVYSTLNNNTYGVMSGTSMAAPNVTGLSTLVLEQFRKTFPDVSKSERLDLVRTALMNTAGPVNSRFNTVAIPRQIGAGLANVDRALTTPVLATVNGEPSVALKNITSARTVTVTLKNHSNKAVEYTVPAQVVYGETTNAQHAIVSKVSGSASASVSSVSVPANGTATVDFTITPGDKGYVEGWLKLESADKSAAPDLSVPYLGFNGDWNEEPIILPADQTFSLAPEAKSQLLTSWGGSVIPLHPDPLWGLPEFYLSPNGDGDMDTIALDYFILRNAEEVKYSVEDANGKVVRELGGEQEVTRYTAALLGKVQSQTNLAKAYGFDGTYYDPAKADFAVVPNGKYFYVLKARLPESTEWQTFKFPFDVDATAPVITFSDRADDGTVTIDIDEQGSHLLAEPTVTDQTGKEYTVTTVTDGSKYSVKIGDEPIVLTAAVNDAGFNQGVASRAYNGISLLVPDAESLDGRVVGKGTSIVHNDKLLVQGFYGDDVKKVTVNGEEEQIANGRFNALTPLTPGENTITVVAYDAGGTEVGKVEFTVYYDNVDPVLNVTGTFSSDKVLQLSPEGTVTVTGTITDDHAPKANQPLTVKVGKDTVNVGADGSFTHTFKPSAKAKTVEVVGSDSVNFVSESFVIQGRVPAPTGFQGPIFTNLDGDGYRHVLPNAHPDIKDGVFTLRGKLVSPMDKLTFTPGARAASSSSRDAGASSDTTIVGPAPIEATINADGTFEVPLPFESGFNNYRMLGTKDDKPVFDHPLTLMADSVLPEISFEKPGTVYAGRLFVNKPEVQVKGTASDDAWGYQLLVNDSSVIDLFNYSGLGKPSNEREFDQTIPAKDGDTLYVLLRDANGNALVNFTPVVLDETKPVVTTSIEDSKVITDKAPVTVDVKDVNLAGVNVTLNGKDVDSYEASVSKVAYGDTLVDVKKAGDANGVLDTEKLFPKNTEKWDTEKSFEVPTADLAAGVYTLTVTGTDFAGNVVTKTVTFKVDNPAVINGDSPADVEVYSNQLTDQKALQAAALAKFSVTDDGTPAHPGQNATLAFKADTILVKGTNNVTLVATDADGKTVSRDVVVNIKVKTVTLEDKGVTATGEFGEGDALNVTIDTKDNETTYNVKHAAGVGTVKADITLPYVKDGEVFTYVDGKLVRVDATVTADGKFAFKGEVDGVYVVKVKTQTPPERPTPKPGETPKPAPAEPGKPLAKTGAEASVNMAAAALLLVSGLGLVMIRRRYER